MELLRTSQYNVVKGEILTKMYDTEFIAKRMYRLRKKKLSMTQEEFSELTQLSKDTISNIERKKYCPSLQTLITISNSTGMSIEYFLDKNKE